MKVGMSEPRSQRTLCRLLGKTRQAYHKRVDRAEKKAIESEFVIREVASIRTQQRKIGTRKLHGKLSGFFTEHSIGLGRDAFFDLLRENGMLVRRRRRKVPRTTVSALWMKRYPNLARDFTPTASGQLWVSDITYVRIGEGFGYLSLVTDAYSRKIVGFHLSRDLSANGCIRALSMALEENPQTDGLIHHSDRGLQYYSSRYIKLLGTSVRISMSERSDPLENAIAERVNGILKQELLKSRFESYREAQDEIDKAIGIYNHHRPHLSIDMLTPAEAHTRTGELKRRWKNYYSRTKPAPASA